jgi:hypothetical protein
MGIAEVTDASGDRDGEALGKQLPNQPSAAGADSEPEHHLARPHRPAAGQEAGDVGARHAEDGDGQDRQDHEQSGIEWADVVLVVELRLRDQLDARIRIGKGTFQVEPDRP